MPTITAVKRQQKNRKRLSIYIDGRFAFGCSEEVWLSLGLARGDQFSGQDRQRLESDIRRESIRGRAFSYLARRSRSVSEMRDYLRRKEYEPDEIEQMLDWLEERDYLNDSRFASDWVRSRLRTAPRGRRRLLMELYQKGIDRALAEQTVAELLQADDEEKIAHQLIKQRSRRFAGLERLEIKRKIYNFLGYRGFTASAIAKASEKFLEEMIEER